VTNVRGRTEIPDFSKIGEMLATKAGPNPPKEGGMGHPTFRDRFFGKV
jgi:hypothetical protein